MIVETWRPVVGFDGKYEVSDLGRVRSLDRMETFRRILNNGVPGDVTRPRHGRILAASLGSHGYLTVGLCRKTHAVHTLVLAAFKGPRPPGMEGCHRDGIRTNNSLMNLCWDTPQGNWIDRKLHQAKRGVYADNGSAKLTTAEVDEIRRTAKPGDYQDIASRYGVHRSTIRKAAIGQSWKNLP